MGLSVLALREVYRDSVPRAFQQARQSMMRQRCMGTLELGIFSGVLSAADKAARPLGRHVRTPAFGAPVRAPLSISGRAPTRASPASSGTSRPFVQARAGSRAGDSGRSSRRGSRGTRDTRSIRLLDGRAVIASNQTGAPATTRAFSIKGRLRKAAYLRSCPEISRAASG